MGAGRRSIKGASREVIEELYWGRKLSLHQIAGTLGATANGIKYRMIKFGIPRRPQGPWNKGLSKEHDERLKKVSEAMTGRCSHTTKMSISREELQRLYWGQGLNTRQIGEMFALTPHAVQYEMKQYGIRVRDIHECHRGIGLGHPCYWNRQGLHHSEETRRKIAIANTGKPSAIRGKRGWGHGLTKTDPRIAKMAESIKQVWQDSEYVAKMMRARKVKPNNTELQFDAFLQNHLPGEYKYVGDGEFILGGKCPDWLNVNGQKKLIELFGDYWHKGENPQDKIDHYKKYGFDTLVIWASELQDKTKVLQTINDFNNKEVNHG